MLITNLPNLSNIQTVPDLTRFLTPILQNFIQAINGKITFKDNFLCDYLVSVDFTSNSTQTVSHNLGYVPNGYILVYSQRNENVFAPLPSQGYVWTDSVIYLSSVQDPKNQIKVLIF